MGRLQNRLDRIKIAFREQAPAEALAVIDRASDDLVSSDILSHVPKAGSALPDFALKDTDGEVVRSTDLLAQGPLVVSVYRGLW